MDKARDAANPQPAGGRKIPAPPAGSKPIADADKFGGRTMFRLSSVGNVLPDSWSYGDVAAEDVEEQSGFQVWTDLARVAQAAAEESDDGDYSSDAGYDSLLLVNASSSSKHAGGNFWNSVEPDSVKAVWSVDTSDLVEWLKEESGTWDEEEGRFNNLFRWCYRNEDKISAWIDTHAKPVEAEALSTLHEDDEDTPTKSLPPSARSLATRYAEALATGHEQTAFVLGKAFAAAYPELELCVKATEDAQGHLHDEGDGKFTSGGSGGKPGEPKKRRTPAELAAHHLERVKRRKAERKTKRKASIAGQGKRAAEEVEVAKSGVAHLPVQHAALSALADVYAKVSGTGSHAEAKEALSPKNLKGVKAATRVEADKAAKPVLDSLPEKFGKSAKDVAATVKESVRDFADHLSSSAIDKVAEAGGGLSKDPGARGNVLTTLREAVGELASKSASESAFTDVFNDTPYSSSFIEAVEEDLGDWPVNEFAIIEKNQDDLAAAHAKLKVAGVDVPPKDGEDWPDYADRVGEALAPQRRKSAESVWKGLAVALLPDKPRSEKSLAVCSTEPPGVGWTYTGPAMWTKGLAETAPDAVTVEPPKDEEALYREFRARIEGML